jgi:hypothetical protein
MANRLCDNDTGLNVLIDGSPVTEQNIIGRKKSSCDQCHFGRWQPGDVCFIVEHWLNESSSHGAREHLCPLCAFQRGLPESLYHQNEKAPPVDLDSIRPQHDEMISYNALYPRSNRQQKRQEWCQYCGKTQVSWSIYTAGLVEVKLLGENTYSYGKVCLDCVFSHFKFRPRDTDDTNAGIKRKNPPVPQSDDDEEPQGKKKPAL